MRQYKPRAGGFSSSRGQDHPDPLLLVQVVRRRTQRRKSTITALLFGESSASARQCGHAGVCPHAHVDVELPPRGPGVGCGHHCSLGLLGEDDLEALKAKNIKQTELVADLREAILRVARHFQCTDPKNCSVVSRQLPGLLPNTALTPPTPLVGLFSLWQELTPDYSMESHQRDHENYVACSRSHRRRAKALLDFERHDDDELGFRKNDIITVRWGRWVTRSSGCGGFPRLPPPSPTQPLSLPRASLVKM